MPVYVDDYLFPATVPNGARSVSGKWSHLTADTTEELHAFAAKLGLRRSWFQPAKLIADNEYTRKVMPDRIGKPCRGSRDHYDVTECVRAKALQLGAVAVKFGGEPWRRDSWRKECEEDDQREESRRQQQQAVPVSAEADTGAPTETGGTAPEQARNEPEPVNDGSRYGQ